MKSTCKNLPLFSSALVVALLGVVPFASRFTPDPTDAGLQQLQTLVVLAGIFVAALSVIPVRLSLGNSRSWHRTVTLYAACLACFAIGWRCVPYWATGVYARDLGLFPPADMDPKRLVPMIWLGEVWRIVVLLAALATGVSAPLLIGVAFHAALRGFWMDSILTFVFAVLAGGFLFWYQIDYTAWLMD